jgi:hypothetical protein
VHIPQATVARVAAATALTTAVAAYWHTAGALTIVEIGVMSLVAIVSLIVLGERTPWEREPG